MLFHLTNLRLISGAAFLVVVLIRRYTGAPRAVQTACVPARVRV